MTNEHSGEMPSGEDEARRDLLLRVDLLAGLDRVALARLVAHIEPQPIEAGAVVCEQGDPSDALYIVVRGRFGVFVRAADDTERRISSLGPGDYFGEIGLLIVGTRSATVRVETDGELLRLDREAFLRLLDEDPTAGRAVATALARRLRERDLPFSGPAITAPTVAVTSGRSVPRPERQRAVKAAGVAVALVLCAASFFVDLAQWRFSLFVLAAVALWVTEPVPTYVVSLALVAAWVISGIAPAYAAIHGFASLNWIFVVAVLGIAGAVARSGLLLRLGILLIERVPSGLGWQSTALLGTGILLTPLLPLAMARAAITAPLGVAVADALRLRDREPASAVLGLSAWVGAGPFLFLFMNGSPVCLMLWSLMPGSAQDRFNWLFWLVSAAPLGVMIAAGMFIALRLLNRPGPVATPRRERLRLQHAVLGPPSRSEIAVAVIVGLTLVGWIVGPVFLIQPGLVALLAFMAVTVATRSRASDLARLDWGYLIFYGVALSLSDLVEGLRLDEIVAVPAGARLVELGISGPVFVLFVGLLTVLVRSVLPADQAVILLGLALIPIAGAVGVHPWLVVIAILTLALSWHVVAQTPEYLVAHVASDGRLYSHGQARRAAFAYLVVAFIALALSLPYWRLLGIV